MIRLSCSLPNIDQNPTSYLDDNYDSGTTLSVQNTAPFATGDYILVALISTSQCEIGQIQSITDSNTLELYTGLNFPHPSDTVLIKMDYNQYKVYRSTTGVDGSYSLLDTNPLPVSQNVIEFTDTTGISPYSYKFSFYNSTTAVESNASDQVPFDGFPVYSLRAMQDRVIDLFGDPTLEFISRDMLTDWFNELTSHLQYKLSDGSSPYFLTTQNITSTAALTYDLSTYNMVSIAMIEYSTDNGVTFQQQMNPGQFSFHNPLPTAGNYSWRLGGTTLFIDNPLPRSYIMRIWYWTLPTLLSAGSDYVPFPFRAYTQIYVNYGLQRANEKDRKYTEAATYYAGLVTTKVNEIVPLLKERIKAGNMQMATTWADDYSY